MKGFTTGILLALTIIALPAQLAFAADASSKEYLELSRVSSQASKKTRQAVSIEKTFLKLFPYFYSADEYSCISGSSDSRQTQQTFYQLHQEPRIVAIQVTDLGTANAFALRAGDSFDNPATIVLSNSLLEQITHDDELAFVLAHEMAHLDEDHFRPDLGNFILSENQRKTIEKIEKNWELIADGKALAQVEKTGFNPSISRAFLEKIAHAQVLTGHSLTERHPKVSERLSMLKNSDHFDHSPHLNR